MPTPPRRHALLPAGALLALLAAAPAVAQPVSPAPAGAVPARAARIATLPAGVPVRVVAGAQRVTGRFQRVAFDTLVVGVREGEAFRAPVAGVDTLWARTGRATRRGAAIGAGLGGVALGALAGLLAYGLCETPGGCSVEVGIVVAGAAIGAAGGGLLGAGIGSAVRSWRRVLPQP